MKKILPLLLAAPAFVVPASAQTRSEGTSHFANLPNLDALLTGWRIEKGSSWRVTPNAATGFAEMIYGGGAEPAFRPVLGRDHEWIGVARDFLQQTESMHGVSSATLVDDRTAFLPLGQGSTTDKMTVRFRQEVSGIAVARAFVNVLLDAEGQLLSVQTTAVPELEVTGTVPAISAGRAQRIAAEQFEQLAAGPATAIDAAELAFVRDENSPLARLAWRTDVRREVSGAEPEGWKYSIDALTGAVLAVENVIHFFDVFGTLETLASPGVLPDIPTNLPVAIPMPYARITTASGTFFTDENGDFNIPGVNVATNLTVEYAGEYNLVLDDMGAPLVMNVLAQPNQQQTITLNAAPSEFTTSQANGYLHINTVRDWIKSVFPTDTTADFQAVTRTNLPFTCNAFFDGVSTNYFIAGGSCANTAYSSVVAHEFGHWLNNLYGTFNGPDGMGEGNADMFSMYVYNDPVVGREFFQGGFIRTGNNTRQFCGVGCGGCHGGVHAGGEVWMGAGWKIRENINDALTSDTLFLGWMNAYDQMSIEAIIEEQWLTLDDDNANIDDGTPNYQAIDDGFTEQGFPGFKPAFLDITNVTVLSDTQFEEGPYVIDATVAAPFNPPVASATLKYRLGNTGAFTDLPMANTGGNDWQAALPNVSSPAVVQYYVSAVDNAAMSSSEPSLAPNDLFEFRIGDVTIFAFFDFEGASDQGWFAGDPTDDATTGIWERINPMATGAQPEDDHTPNGIRAWTTGRNYPNDGVGANDVDGGKTTLFSPVFDATLVADPSISYWRWYSNNVGGAPNADELHVDISGDGGATWVNAEIVGPGGVEANGACWRYHEFRVADFLSPTNTMQLRFIASDLGDGSIVEAVIDDLTMFEFGEGCSPPANYCQAAANSVGAGATVGTTGTPSIATNDFGVTATGLPPNEVGRFYYGPVAAQGQLPFGNGFRCIVGAAYRLPFVMSNAQGDAAYTLDLTMPTYPGSEITSGSTSHFQYWYRDMNGGGAMYNLSDAVAVEFCN